ncbi:MAG TPA: MFS transporter [Steroidobacteraceae bacterium]|nr:MFS transporter [Steroidobacteraceae bacterium]
MGTAIPTRRAAVWALGVLTGVNLLNYLDRYIVSAIAPDLKQAMALSDTQLGWLMPIFMLIYMVAAPVFGTWGDRGSRTRPIALGVFVWSLATLLSGFARSYPQLLLGRALVGIGEAAYVAIAPALLADCFAVDRRGRVYAVLNMAIPVGAALGYIVGGAVSVHFGWRAAFLVAGVPGLALALWVLRLPDPPRGVQDARLVAPATAPRAPGAQPGPVAVYLGLLGRWPYLLVVLGYAAYTFGLGGLAFWMPTFLERMRDVPAETATIGFGKIVLATGFLGTFAGGWLGDRLLRFSRQAYLWFAGVITLLAAPCALLALTATAPGVYFPAIVAAELLLFMSTGPINAAIVNIAAPFERASAIALSMFAIHLLGDVPSPLLIGYLSDLSSLGRAVLIVPLAVAASGVVWLIAAGVSARAVRPAAA